MEQKHYFLAMSALSNWKVQKFKCGSEGPMVVIDFFIYFYICVKVSVFISQ